MNKTKHRLEDKLNLILIVLENQGIKIDELLKFTSHNSKDKLKKDLESLVMVGSYPYQPIDLVDIEIEGDRIFAKLPASIDKSISLLSEECFGILDLILKEINFGKISESDKKIYNQIISKLRPIIPFQDFSANVEKKDLIQKAIDEQKKVKFNYKALKKENLEEKIVNPSFLFYNKAEEYFSGYYDSPNSVRFFKITNISNLEILDKKINIEFQPENESDSLEEFNSFLQTSLNNSQDSILEIFQSIEFNLNKQIDFEILETKENILTIQTKIPDEVWFLNLIKSYGDKIKIISPSSLKEKYIQDLKNTREPEFI